MSKTRKPESRQSRLWIYLVRGAKIGLFLFAAELCTRRPELSFWILLVVLGVGWKSGFEQGEAHEKRRAYEDAQETLRWQEYSRKLNRNE